MEEDPGTIGGPPLRLQPRLLTSPCPTFHSEAELVGGRNRLRRRGLLLGPPPLQGGLWASCSPRHLQVDPTLRRGGARPSGQSPPVSCPGSQPSSIQPWLCRHRHLLFVLRGPGVGLGELGHLGGWQQLCPGGVGVQEALRWGQHHLGKPLSCQPSPPSVLLCSAWAAGGCAVQPGPRLRLWLSPAGRYANGSSTSASHAQGAMSRGIETAESLGLLHIQQGVL